MKIIALVLLLATSALAQESRLVDRLQWSAFAADKVLLVWDDRASQGHYEKIKWSRDERGIYSTGAMLKRGVPLLAVDTLATYLLTRSDVKPVYKILGLFARGFIIGKRIQGVRSHYQ